MQRTATQEMIEFDFLKTTWGKQALLVTRRHEAGRRLAFSLGFGAFEDDDVAGHGMKGRLNCVNL